MLIDKNTQPRPLGTESTVLASRAIPRAISAISVTKWLIRRSFFEIARHRKELLASKYWEKNWKIASQRWFTSVLQVPHTHCNYRTFLCSLANGKIVANNFRAQKSFSSKFVFFGKLRNEPWQFICQNAVKTPNLTFAISFREIHKIVVAFNSRIVRFICKCTWNSCTDCDCWKSECKLLNFVG